MADLRVVDPGSDREKNIRRSLGRSIRGCLDDRGAGLAGFAIVTWDMRGEVASALRCDHGPIGRSMVPVFCQDALNRHITKLMTEEAASVPIDGGA